MHYGYDLTSIMLNIAANTVELMTEALVLPLHIAVQIEAVQISIEANAVSRPNTMPKSVPYASLPERRIPKSFLIICCGLCHSQAVIFSITLSTLTVKVPNQAIVETSRMAHKDFCCLHKPASGIHVLRAAWRLLLFPADGVS